MLGDLGPRNLEDGALRKRAEQAAGAPPVKEPKAPPTKEPEAPGVRVRLKKQVEVQRGAHKAMAPVSPPVTLRQMGCVVTARDHEPFKVDERQLLMTDRSQLFERVEKEV